MCRSTFKNGRNALKRQDLTLGAAFRPDASRVPRAGCKRFALESTELFTAAPRSGPFRLRKRWFG
jgi:hypothetical protein